MAKLPIIYLHGCIRAMDSFFSKLEKSCPFLYYNMEGGINMEVKSISYIDCTNAYENIISSTEKNQQDFNEVLTVTTAGGKRTMLCKGALFSMGCAATGESGNVYRAENYSEEMPLYLVKGIDENGEEYEQIIDASKINPSNCSFIELMVISVESGNTSSKNFMQMSIMRDKSCSNSYFDKADYLSSAYELLNEQTQLGNWESYLQYDIWINSILDLS